MALLSKWRNIGFLVSVLLTPMILSCGVGGGFEGSLQVFNDGNVTMSQLFVAHSTSSEWGVDQLWPSGLQPGESITLVQLYPDSYDVLATFSDGSKDEVFDVVVQDGVNTTLGMMNTGNGAVAVINNSGITINGIYLAPASASTWGPNQTDQPLLSGHTLTLSWISPGSYDLRVIFSDGSFGDYSGINVSSGTVSTIQVN